VEQRQRRGGVRVAVPTLVLVAATACGLPGDTGVRAVDDDSVPYRLLDPERPAHSATAEGPVPVGVPVVFWLRGDGRLAPTAVATSCADRSEDVVDHLLGLLEVPPDEGARSAGMSSAIPPSSALDVVAVEGSEALVALDPGTSITADRLPLVVGQLVLTVTSAPGVDAVRLSIDGDAVQVPLPGGALTSRAVSADDYASLLPDRYLDRGEPAGVVPYVGCRGAEGPHESR
jgi:hypothetical protein